MRNATVARKIGFAASLAAAALLVGCASQPPSSFTPVDLNPLLTSGKYKQKVNSFLVLLDSSSSTGLTYEGAGFPEASGEDKFIIEKEFLNRMNQTIPNMKLDYGFRTFGFGPCTSWNWTQLNTPISPYSPSAFQNSLNSQDCDSGSTPMADALDASAGDLQPTQGKVAVILVSDGLSTSGDPWNAAKRLHAQIGDRLCIHTVWVGNPDEAVGEKLMKTLPPPGTCGSYSYVGNVASSAGVADFVTKVFLEPAAGDCSTRDEDHDGVNDCIDQCPGTPPGARVNSVGCWVLNNVLFDFDKSTIKPVSYPILDEVVQVLKRSPTVRVEIDGHTDGVGTESYNLQLSRLRAASVRQYLIGHGIAADRLTSQGFGKSKPIATNETDEGRALNRRVELQVVK